MANGNSKREGASACSPETSQSSIISTNQYHNPRSTALDTHTGQRNRSYHSDSKHRTLHNSHCPTTGRHIDHCTVSIPVGIHRTSRYYNTESILHTRYRTLRSSHCPRTNWCRSFRTRRGPGDIHCTPHCCSTVSNRCRCFRRHRNFRNPDRAECIVRRNSLLLRCTSIRSFR